jgi:hypothetical protein
MLADVAILALFATFVACTARVLPPWPARWLAQKPLACPLCMAFWSCAVSAGLLSVLGVFAPTHLAEGLVGIGAAVGLATYLCAQTGLFAPPLDLGSP